MSTPSNANGLVSFTTNDVYTTAATYGSVPYYVYIAGNGPNGWSGYSMVPIIGSGSSYISGNTITMPFFYEGGTSEYLFVDPSPSPTPTPTPDFGNPTPTPYNSYPTETPYNPYPTSTADNSNDLIIQFFDIRVVFGAVIAIFVLAIVAYSMSRKKSRKSKRKH